MKRLKEKLKSKDGASLILSLLVFLLCIMVAASILAAAVSNAGKARSDRVEQQRYQALSSAMRLVCGELEKVEYKGKYRVYTLTDTTTGKNLYYCKQEKDGEIAMSAAHSAQSFKLTNFDFMGGPDGSGGILNKEMDDVFRKQFQDADGNPKTGYGPLEDDDVITAAGAAASPIRLTVTLPSDLDGYPYEAGGMPYEEYEIPKTANIKIELDHDKGSIKLTAWLDDSGTSPSKGSGIMVAEMEADIGTNFVPKISVSGTYEGTDSSIIGRPDTVETPETVTVTWKLDQMSMRTAP